MTVLAVEWFYCSGLEVMLTWCLPVRLVSVRENNTEVCMGQAAFHEPVRVNLGRLVIGTWDKAPVSTTAVTAVEAVAGSSLKAVPAEVRSSGSSITGVPVVVEAPARR